MHRVRVLAMFLVAALAGPALAQTVPQGNPDYPGRLELTYPDDKAVAQIDGDYLTDVNDGKVVQEFDQGVHEFKVYARKGLFDLVLKQDTTLDIPGGYVVRATLRKDALVVVGYTPIPGQALPPPPDQAPGSAPGPAPGPNTVTSTTKLGLAGNTFEFSTSQTVQGGPPGPDSSNPPPPPRQRPAAKSQLVLTSEKGQCEVYLDGKKVADLGMSFIDDEAEAVVRDLAPATYRIKVSAFNQTWYEGRLTVEAGQVIKIHVEPDTFDIVSRDPL